MKPDTNSANWSSSYSQYLARSAALSARTLNQYQLVLERISEGKLPPTVFQDHFPAFATSHSAEFSKRLSEVTSRFLTDLVGLGSSFAQKSKPGTPEPEIVPPRFDASNPARWYQELAEYAGQLNARAVKTYREQLDRVAAGEATPSEAQQEAKEQMSRDLPGLMESMTHAYFEFLNGLNDVRSAYEDTYFHGLLSGTRDDGSISSILTLAGPLGATASASLEVTNATGQSSRILHQVFDVRRVDGVGPSLVPKLAFTPQELELAPEEQGTLSLSLQLDPASYDPDALYAGKLQFVGGSEVPLEIELRILATTGAPQSSNSPHPT